MSSVVLEVSEGIAVITLNRPDHLNVCDAGMIESLGELYRRCDDDDAVRIVIVTGAGEAFCAGADLSQGADTFAHRADRDFSSCPLSTQPWAMRKPVIAACNGHAIGMGLSLALQCDMRVFASDSWYGLLQNRRGVVADNAVEFVLARLVGVERAFEMIVRAPRLRGDEARDWGLAGRAVAAGAVLETAMELARDMVAHCSPMVMAMHKRLIWRGLDMHLNDFIDLETQALHYSMERADALEGGMAWVEKRPPRWQPMASAHWPAFLDSPDQ